MSKKIFNRGLDENTLPRIIAFLRQECHKQITENLGKYQLCIRHNYINIYSNGCSLLKCNPNDPQKELLVHYKYLNDSKDNYDKKSPYVPWDVNTKINFNWGKIKFYTDKAKEKSEIAKYLEAQKDKRRFLLLDLEVAFARNRDSDEIKEETKRELVADRIDMACIYLKNGNPILRLIEVKLTDDARLKSDQAVKPYIKPKIIKQMQHYQKFIEIQRSNITNSYKKVAENYLELITQNIIRENYFSSIDGLNPKDILNKFRSNPQIDEKPYLLLLGENILTNGRNGQNHWQKLLELFKNKYPEPELWTKGKAT